MCSIFARQTACKKCIFQIVSQKNAQIVNLKNLHLDLIRRIHPECGFYEFMIRFLICPPPPPKKKKIGSWIFPAQNASLKIFHPGERNQTVADSHAGFTGYVWTDAISIKKKLRIQKWSTSNRSHRP